MNVFVNIAKWHTAMTLLAVLNYYYYDNGFKEAMVWFFPLGNHKIFGHSLTEDAVLRIFTLIDFLKQRKYIVLYIYILVDLMPRFLFIKGQGLGAFI